MQFVWDPNKAAINIAKHGVSFEEAASVFGDPLSNTYSDSSSFGHRAKIHYYWNVRAGKMLVVAHTDDGEEVRIISAREMTAGERKAYEED